MHLVFTSYDGKNEFNVQEKNNTDFEMSELFDLYGKSETGSEGMKLYLELFVEEKRIAQQRSQLLKDLKEDFKDIFLPLAEEENPEYFL